MKILKTQEAHNDQPHFVVFGTRRSPRAHGGFVKDSATATRSATPPCDRAEMLYGNTTLSGTAELDSQPYVQVPTEL